VNDQHLRQAIADLAAIDEAGQLGELRAAYAAECRRVAGHGRPCERDLQTMQAPERWRADDIARAAAELLGLPLAECERVAHDVLVRDPWRDIALALIAEYRPQPTTWAQDGREAKPARRQAW
jgi:hypothetical protein